MKNQIELRGHHIGVLALYYDQLQENKEAYKRMSNALASAYGRNIQGLFERILTSIQDNSNLKIKVVDRLDTICEADCPMKKPDCVAKRLYDEDSHMLKTYQLNLEEVYTAREILEKIIDFKRRFNVGSPRQVQVAAIALETTSY